MMQGLDLELFRDLLKDDSLHIAMGKIVSVFVAKDRSNVKVLVSIWPEEREIYADMTWDACGVDSGFFMLPSPEDMVLVGMVEGDEDHPYVLKRLSTKVEKIPLQAIDGNLVARSPAGKKAVLTSDTKICLSKGDSDPTEPLVLGNQLKTLLSQLLSAIASHTHSYTDEGVPMTTGAPTQSSSFTSLKSSSVDNSAILSGLSYTEK